MSYPSYCHIKRLFWPFFTNDISRVAVPVVGQPAASVCSKQQACAVHFSTTAKYKRQELDLCYKVFEGCHKSRIVLLAPFVSHPFSSLLTLQWASPGAPQPKAAAGGTDGLGEEEISNQQGLARGHWLQSAGAWTPRAWSQQGSGRYPHNQHGNGITDRVECNRRLRTLDKLESLVQHAAIFPCLKPSALNLKNPSGCCSLSLTSITQSTKSRLRKHQWPADTWEGFVSAPSTLHSLVWYFKDN